ncbi:MAG: histidine phosphatase family protein [Candidatus Rokubacteria bacterium]|nr:histidine phosphatase family protein [Candidatus Rokubacteria bacterium]
MSDRRWVRRLGRFAPAALAISLVITPALAADDGREAWDALAEGGHVALVRHGNAPGLSLGRGGDPPGFRIDDCATQRNLDETGRAQATALGEAFRTRAVRVDRIQSSPWCRCMETARLMAVGQVETSWALVPATDRNPNAPAALRALQEMVSNWRGPGTLVLVTHGLTVRALLGIVPGQAETVVLKPTPGSGSGARVVGRIAAPH